MSVNYCQPKLGPEKGEKMAKLIEVWTLATANGASIDEAKVALKSLAELAKSNGASEIALYNGSYGPSDQNWVMTVTHANSEAWGKYHDKMRAHASSPAGQALTKTWVDNPVLSWKESGLLVEESL